MKSNRQRIFVLSVFLFALYLSVIFRIQLPNPLKVLVSWTESSVPNASVPKPSLPNPSDTSNSKREAASAAKEDFDLPAHAMRVADKVFGFPAGGIPVLMYHAIEFLPGNSLGVPPQQFAEEMEYLDRHGFRTLSLNELSNILKDPRGTPIPAHPIVLTFDDGYADNYQTAWPIMHKYGFVGTFFVVTNSVGPGMMTWDNLRDLAQHGNSVSSHTVHHYDLTTLPSNLLQRELVNSKAVIEKALGTPVPALCYPSGRYNLETQKALATAGYTLAFTTEPGKVNPSANPLALKRVRINGGLSLMGFIKLVD